MELVQLTGQPRVVSGSDVVPFAPDKRYQLLAYLAYNRDWTGRERVASLFWPDTDTANSKQNLRALLQRVKAVPFSDEVSVTPHQLLWAPETDLARYRTALREGRDDDALAAYAGPLLEGLESDDDGDFSEWLQIEREKLHGDWRGLALARIRASGGETRFATELFRRLLDHDPLDEEAVRVYVGAMAGAGKVDEARAAYRSFVARLRSEMGLEPTSATVRAFEDLDRVAIGADTRETISSEVSTAVDESASDRLPTLATTFVGRVIELSDVIGRLRDPTCRMLTVVGPGGVGKTRLALQAARELRDDFDAVVFVGLDSLSSPDEVPTAIAGALGIPLAAGASPLKQVERALRDTRTLLLLDNFEQVLDAAQVVSSLLEAGPGMKVLVSSRVRLSIEQEWLFPLEGLDYPADEVPAEFAVEFPAVRLFVERARRVRPRFAPDQEQVAQIVRFCRLVAGLPLAIELAAAWVRALPLAEIVAGLENNLDLLESSDRDAIPRHRSIRATFEQSWSLLSDVEQGVMRRLAVFRGAVRPDSASFVAEAPHVVLAALVDKSLLRLGDDGRYDRHPLLLAYAQEKLDELPEERGASEGRHAAYYLRFLRERTDKARGPRPAATLKEIDGELAEILAAARLARQRGDGRQLVALVRLLAVDTGYLMARGFGSESIELVEAASDAAVEAGMLEAAHDLKGRLGDALGVHHGEKARALGAYKDAAALARRCGNAGREAVLLSMFGVMGKDLDDPDATSSLDAALALAEEAGDDLSLATVLEHRAYVAGRARDYEASRELYERSLEIVDRLSALQAAEPYELHRRRFFVLLNAGETEQKLGNHDGAFRMRREALSIAEVSGNSVWAAHASYELGVMCRNSGDDASAREHLMKAVELYRENHLMPSVDRVRAVIADYGFEPQIQA